MKTYANKNALIAEIKQRFTLFDQEFDTIAESLKDKRVDRVDKTPTEILAYQLGWTNLLLFWESEEKQCNLVQMPAAGFKWNNLGGLYATFYQQYAFDSLATQRKQLQAQVDAICAWISRLSESELFEPQQRQWTAGKAQWPLWKWIHINTVAPFTNFRSRIRKWKKQVLTPSNDLV